MLDVYEDATLFAPNPGGQSEFLDDTRNRYVALAGGWFAGKTWAGARKLVNQHCWNAFDEEGNLTFAKSLVVAQNYSLAQTICKPELQRAFEEMGLPYRWVGDPKRFCFELPTLGKKNRPSEILLRSADAPETITGFSVALAWGDEVARWPQSDDPVQDPLVQLYGRLRSAIKVRVIQAFFTFTHEGDTTRVYQDFEENPKPGHVLYRAGTFDNPHAKEFGEETQKQLSSDLADQYLSGKAISLRGNAMYPGFNKQTHVTDTVQLRDDLPLQVSIDFNFRPGMHLVVGQWDEKADLFTARHLIHQPQMTVPRMIHSLKDLIEKRYGGYRWPGQLQVFGDENGGRVHSAERGETKWAVVKEYLDAAGLPFTFRKHSNNPFISDRVNAVNAALLDAREQIHYRIHPDCDRLIDDLKQQKWTVEGETDKADLERSHAAEAEGYRIHYLRPVRKLRSVNAQVVMMGR